MHMIKKSLFILLVTLASSCFAQNQVDICESGINFKFNLYKNKYLRLLSMLPDEMSSLTSNVKADTYSGNEVFIHLSGENRDVHHGDKLTGGALGARLVFIKKTEEILPLGKRIIIVQKDTLTGLIVNSYYEFFAHSPTVRRYTEVKNNGSMPVGIEYISSAMLHNFNIPADSTPDQNIFVYLPYNSWQQEAQWKKLKPSELGLDFNGVFNLNAVSATNTGTFSSIKYLPMAMIENHTVGITWFWQIEHNGSWHWEFSTASSWDNIHSTYLYLGGPDEYHHQAWDELSPGESFKTVPVALGCVKGGFNEAVAALTVYRREVLLKNQKDNVSCPVIFNDYMNCLFGDPTTEKEMPLIDAAAKTGCDYYVIDAGWYAELNESWWDAVGLWEPSKSRFPGGLQKLLDYISQKGMKPGLWLEIEVVGINSPLKNKPDSWFMMRHGKRVIDNGRYLLDFRNPEVIAHCDAVIERLVKSYGIRYIKMDYNINALTGTETNVESFGQGLLQHNRAVVNWYLKIAEKYPELTIENCGSGGCRMDYAMLSATSLQSLTDQTNYLKIPAILVGGLAAVLPEQLTPWSYPKVTDNEQAASFNMVNVMMCRILQSGHLAQLSGKSINQIKTGIAIYKKSIAPYIPSSIPFFPLGLPSVSDSNTPVAVGLKSEKKEFIAVWRLQGDNSVKITTEETHKLRLLYPRDLDIRLEKTNKGFEVIFPSPNMAAIIEIDK